MSDLLTLKHTSKILRVPIASFYAERDTLAELLIKYVLLNKSSQRKLILYAINELEKQ